MRSLFSLRSSTAIRTFLALGAVSLGVLLLGSLSGRSASAQASAPRPGQGRYSITADNGRVYFLDSVTGQLWFGGHQDDAKKMIWYEANSPVRSPR